MHLSAGGAVPVLFTQGAVLGGQQQMALPLGLASLGTGLRAFPQQAAGQRRAPPTGLVGQTGQTGRVCRAGTGAVRLQEKEGNLLEGGQVIKKTSITASFIRNPWSRKLAEMKNGKRLMQRFFCRRPLQYSHSFRAMSCSISGPSHWSVLSRSC